MSVTYFQFTKLKNKDDFVKASAPEELFDQCQKAISSLTYYQNHQFRKNGVMCLDLFFVGTLSETEYNGWLKTNQMWVQQYFNQPVLLDNNETKTEDHYEQHIYIIPLSPRGAVSCDWYCGGKEKLRYMHSSYTALISKELGISTVSSHTFFQGQNKSPGYNPFSDIHMPDVKQYSSITSYADDVSEYVRKLEIRYETKIQNLQGQISVKTLAENKLLQKENHKLSKHLDPFISFLTKYGGINKAEQMLYTAQLYQYAIRLYQEDGDGASIDAAKQILNDGIKYMEKHHIQGR